MAGLCDRAGALKRAEIHIARRDHHLHAQHGILSIRDTGMGIAPEDLPRIFERGYTGCNGRTDRRSSGIGLYLCRRVCDALGHTITARSAPGEGTEIRIGLRRRGLTIE